MRGVARRYLAAGLSVLPAAAKQKRPTLSGWKQYQQHLPRAHDIDRWWTDGQSDACCIVAGAVSGNLELLDFDHGGELFAAWKELIPDELLGRLVVEQSRSGGRHVVYRCETSINGNMKLAQGVRDGQLVTLIETRGEGGLFLCAPTTGYVLEQGSLERVPILTSSDRELLLEAAWSLNEHTPPVFDPIPGQPQLELRPGDDFNNRGDVRDILLRNGWVLAKSGDNEYWRRPGKSDGWSATLRDRVLYVFSSNALPFEPERAYSPFAVYSLLEHGGDYEAAAKDLRTEGYGSDAVVSLPYSAPPAICSDDDIPSPEPIMQPSDPGPMPEHMLRIPGFVSEVMDFCTATAPYPNQVMAFTGALALQAFLAGRKVRDPGDNRTNLYLLGLAHSAAGKDWPRKLNTRILHEIGLSDAIGERFASGEGIQDALFLSPNMLFQTDEIDGMLQSINKSRDARHENIMTTLLTFYSSANSVYPMRRKAGKESPGAINQPSLVIFGTAIPNHYYEALSERMLTNGFFARMIILECGRRGTGQEPTIAEIPDRVLETAHWWNDYKPGQGNLENFNPIPSVVPHTNEARQILVAARIEAEAEYERAEANNDAVGTTVWGRVSEQSRKLALLYAISQSARNPEIGRDAAAWAVAFVMHQTRRMLCMAGRHVSRNDFDAMAKEMLRVLRAWSDKRGNKPMPEWELSRRLPWKPSDHDDVIKLLRKQKLVECGPSPSKTKPGTIYWLVEA